ncbi:TMEM25 isoform 22 [Pongo abelii]|uniref:TMEM25 isoform 22 n=1 Tax=Pongo abelii TaxID=9601 RepID=A0A2J8X0Z0_PONAB|nr:TMEM25 isoform 22 [Pongo abelii]
MALPSGPAALRHTLLLLPALLSSAQYQPCLSPSQSPPAVFQVVGSWSHK